MRTFKQFVDLKEAVGDSKDWKADSLSAPLAKGFVPPNDLKPVIRAFANSGSIVLMKDVSEKHVSMPKKTLYLVGGPVRDFLKGKTPKDLDLATNATPEQIAVILSAAGFKKAGDRSGKGGEELRIPQFFETGDGPQKVEDAKQGDNKIWFVKGRDNSEAHKAFVISAVVNGNEFEIATFRKDVSVENGNAAVDFADNPKVDASRRDLTINSMYIELTNDEGENKKIYDPTRSGRHDLEHGVVKTVGKAEERFQEDPIRIMRAIRFHCRFGSGEELHDDIRKAIPKFMNLPERIAPNRIRDEFLKGLLNPDIDPQKYLRIYYKTGLLHVVFPGVQFGPMNVPPQFTDKQDKVLALAWLLQHNPVEKVEQVLSDKREVNGESKNSGWELAERKAVVFLLKLKEFDADRVYQFLRQRDITGVTSQQIKSWVEMFGNRPEWSKQVKTFADHRKTVSWNDVQSAGRHICPTCNGRNSDTCMDCKGKGEVPENQRGQVVADMERDKFRQKLK